MSSRQVPSHYPLLADGTYTYLCHGQVLRALPLEVVAHLHEVKRNIRHVVYQQHDHAATLHARSPTQYQECNSDDVVHQHDKIVTASLLDIRAGNGSVNPGGECQQRHTHMQHSTSHTPHDSSHQMASCTRYSMRIAMDGVNSSGWGVHIDAVLNHHCGSW